MDMANVLEVNSKELDYLMDLLKALDHSSLDHSLEDGHEHVE